jgi:hypothetical protein
MQHNLTCGTKEQELEEGVQDLLHHFVVFLLSAQQVLKKLDQVRRSNCLRDVVITADGADQHDTLQQDVIFCVSVHQVVMKKLNQVPLFNLLRPEIGRNVDHCSEQL